MEDEEDRGLRCPFCGIWLKSPQRHECGGHGWRATFRRDRSYGRSR